ncbi:MAG: ABC transporter substrate-binding protein [Planctomycetes bacterium]|nr:ABC transporter substrate-binding protein [Planctomycetota bacterium]
MLVLLPYLSSGCDQVKASPRIVDGESPRRGGCFRTPLNLPRTLDPALLDDVYGKAVATQLFDGLVQLDLNLRPIPGIAEFWEISRDRLDYRFTLRRGVRFHSGQEVTSSDVAYSFERIVDMARRGTSPGFDILHLIRGAQAYKDGQATDISGIRTPEPYVVELELERPHQGFLSALAYENVRIVPRHAAEDSSEDSFGKHPVGTGPFQISSWTDHEIVLRRFDDYFGNAAYLDEVRYVSEDVFKPDDTPDKRFQARQLELLEASDDEVNVLDPGKMCTVVRNRTPSLYYIGFNVDVAPLDDPLVRRAIVLAIDRNRLIPTQESTIESATGLIPPGLFGYSPHPRTPPFDRAEAARLLKQAGHPGGEGLPAIVCYTTSFGLGDNRVADDLRQVGVRMTFKPIAWPALKKMLNEGAAPAFVLGYSGGIADGDQFLFRLFHSKGSANNFHYKSGAVDALLEEAVGTLDSQWRYTLCGRAESQIIEDAPLVPLFYYTSTYVAQPYVRNLLMGPFGLRSVRLDKVWLDDRRGTPR